MVQFLKQNLALATVQGISRLANSDCKHHQPRRVLAEIILLCYGSHDFQNVLKVNLLSYNESYSEASEKTP